MALFIKEKNNNTSIICIKMSKNFFKETRVHFDTEQS